MKMSWSKEQIVQDMQRVVKILGKVAMSGREYQEHGKIGKDRIKKVFGSWNSALLAAGLRPAKIHHYHSDVLIDETSAVYRRLGHIPSGQEWDQQSRISRAVIKSQLGGLRSACRIAQQRHPDLPAVEPVHAMRKCHKYQGEKLGLPMNYPPFLNEPVNEQSTLALFAVLAVSLGFRIIKCRSRFPDILAERRVTEAAVEQVDIEVEFLSRAYLHHHHPHRPIILVCWQNNWADAPPNIEVIELSVLLKKPI
jgi:hypothetical protein